MKSVLSALYDGEIFPAEQYSPKTEEYRINLQKSIFTITMISLKF